MGRNLAPALLARIERLNGCRGRWIVDCRELAGAYSCELRQLSDYWPTESGSYWCQHDEATSSTKGGYKRNSPEAAALYCASTGWRSKLLWCSDWLNDDCLWPGGYDAESVIRSNARVFRQEYASELERADGDADGISLDVRFCTDDMLETLDALESYPLIDEDDHSALQLEDQERAWSDWVERDWRQLVAEALDAFAPEDAESDWGESIADRLDDETLRWLFTEAGGDELWVEEHQSGWWVDLKRAAERLTAELLSEATELPLLSEAQRWRAEPYPWPGAPAAPLLAPLPLEP